MLQEIVSDQVSACNLCVCNLCVCVFLCVSDGARDGENKVMIRTARDGLMSKADEKETEEERKSYRWGERGEKEEVNEREESEKVGQETKRRAVLKVSVLLWSD